MYGSDELITFWILVHASGSPVSIENRLEGPAHFARLSLPL